MRIRKPEKANGTRWIQHKSRALSTLLLGYSAIVTHLELMCSDGSNVKAVDKQRFHSYVKKLTSFKFVIHMLFYDCLLTPLSSFSCTLQSDSVDLTICIAKLKSLLSTLDKLKDDSLDTTSELAKFTASVDWTHNSVEFRGVKLNNVRREILDSFCTSRSGYVDAISNCLRSRFDDL